MCHQSKGLAQRSLIHELNVMRGKELQRYNRPHSETFTCEVCSYVRIQWVCFWRSDSEIIIPCARGVCDFKPHVTVCKFNKLILEDQHAHTSSSPSLVLNISTNTVARDSQKLTDSGATDAGPGIPVPSLERIAIEVHNGRLSVKLPCFATDLLFKWRLDYILDDQ